MTKILILGANGRIARLVIERLRHEPTAELTLFLRDATHALATAGDRTRVFESDVSDQLMLEVAMAGQDLVYVNLSGLVDEHLIAIVAAMQATGLKRLIFISTMGVHDEVPGAKLGPAFQAHRRAAEIVTASGLDWTLLRPAWLSDEDEVAYGLTARGEAFLAPCTHVSRRSVADLVVQLCLDPSKHVRASLGVHRQSAPNLTAELVTSDEEDGTAFERSMPQMHCTAPKRAKRSGSEVET